MEEILNRARQEEKQYEWLKAADCYRKALMAVAETDYLKKGEISEKLAYSTYKAAFQAEHSHEFKERMGQALTYYGEGKRLYERSADIKKAPRIYRCGAMIAFAGYWLAPTAAERRRSLEECWTQTKKALDLFAAEEKIEFGKTFTQLSLSNYLLSFFLDADGYDVSMSALNEGMRYGERAIACLSQYEDKSHLAKAYVQTAIFQDIFGLNLPAPADKERFEQKALSYASEAKQLSEEAALLECYYALGTDYSPDIVMADSAKSLDYAHKAKDKFAIGGALTTMSMHALNKSMITENSDERAELLKKALDYAESARNEFAKLAWISPAYYMNFWVETPYIAYFLLLASDKKDMTERRDLLQKAVDSAPESLKLAEESGTLTASMFVHSTLSRVYFSLANTEPDIDRKKKMLGQALQHESEMIIMVQRCSPFTPGLLGSRRSGLADIKSQIANLTADSEERKNLLREAIH